MTEKSIFHQSIVLPQSLVVRPDGPTDGRSNRTESTIVCCIFCRQLFRSRSRRSQWTNERPFAPWVEPVKWCSQSVSLVSGALSARFSFFQFLFFFFFGVHCAVRSMTTHSFTQSRYWNSMTLIFFATLPPFLPSLFLLQPAPSRVGARGNGL